MVNNTSFEHTGGNLKLFGYEEVEAYVKEHVVLKEERVPEFDDWKLIGTIRFPLLITKVEYTNPELLDYISVDINSLNENYTHYYFKFGVNCNYTHEELKPFAEHEVIKDLVNEIIKSVNCGYVKISFSEEEDGVKGTVTYHVKWPIRLLWHETVTNYVLPKVLCEKGERNE